MASITEVARRAGVSITTVSRVLNPVSEYPVAAATRRRVLAAASALQYSPSALARALVTRRSHMIGVLLGDIVDPYFAEIVRGIEDVARRAGYLVVICNTSRDPGTERRYVTALRDYRADAIIFLGGDIFDAPDAPRPRARAGLHGRPRRRRAGRGRRPRRSAGHRHRPRRRAPRRWCATWSAWVTRRIGFISGPLTVSTARYRRDGFLNAHGRGRAGGRPDRGGRLRLRQRPGRRGAACSRASRRPSLPPTIRWRWASWPLAAPRAWPCRATSRWSVSAIRRAAEHAVPALTAVSMPRHQLGVEAMQAVVDALALEQPRVFPRRLPFHLVIRESSGPPPRALPLPAARQSRNSRAGRIKAQP